MAELVQQLRDPQTSVRWQAATTLGVCLLETPEEKAILALFETTADADPGVVERAIGSLAMIGSHWEFRLGQAGTARTGPAAGSLPVHPLRAIADRVQERIPQLVSLARSEAAGFEVRVAAVAVLGWVGGGRSDVVEALVQGMQSPESRFRTSSAYSLSRLHPAPVNAIPALLQALEDSDRRFRSAVGTALSRIGQPAAQELVQRLDSTGLTRVEVDSSLIEMGQEAVPALIAGAKDERQAIREPATLLLGQIGSKLDSLALEPVLEALVDCLADPEPKVRAGSAEALGRLGTAAKGIAPALQRGLADPDGAVREASRQALERILAEGPKPQ